METNRIRMCRDGADTNIEVIPHELLVKILSPLHVQGWCKAAPTCRAFQAAVHSLLGTVEFLDLKNSGAQLDDRCYSLLTSRVGHTLRRLEVDCWHLTDEMGALIPLGVTEIALCGLDHHSDRILELVAQRVGPTLRRFAFSGFGGRISSAGFHTLLATTPLLTAFALDGNEKLDPNSIVRAVANSCPNLKDLSAYDLSQDTLVYLKRKGVVLRSLRHRRRQVSSFPINDITLLLIAGMCPLLADLALTDHTEGELVGDVTDVGLLALAERSATLRVLKLKLGGPMGAHRCSEVAVMELASACSLLTRIELCHFRLLSDPPIYEIIQHCQGLVDVCFNGAPMTDASITMVVTRCPMLRILSLRKCKLLTEEGVASLGQLSHLETLNVGQAGGVTDASVATICARGEESHIKSLVLNHSHLTDRALETIATCPQLQELALHECHRITNRGLKAISVGCLRLRYLSVSCCFKITDGAIIAIAHSCERLQKIRLDKCRLLSDPCVRALCRPGLRLRYLSMQHCPKLSDEALRHLLTAASIRFVDLGRGKLTQPALQFFHAARPTVELCVDGVSFCLEETLAVPPLSTEY